MSYVILAIVTLALGIIGGCLGGYLVYRNNKKQMDEIICRYDKAMCKPKDECVDCK